VLDQPLRGVAHAQLSHQLRSQGNVLGLGQQLPTDELAGERRFGRFGEPLIGSAAKVMSPGTPLLPSGFPAPGRVGANCDATAGAHELGGPALLDQRAHALFLDSVPIRELGQRQALPVLSSIHPNGASSGGIRR
jgi:hypothetical protein